MILFKVIKKIFPAVFIILIGIVMFWDKGENFLTPNTFNNIGDTCFPLNIDYVNTFLYSWDRRGNFGLGDINFFPVHLPMYLSVLLWSKLGLPLWIANRLWHVLPNIFIGFFAFYLYRSLFTGKYSRICGSIAAVFIMLLPERNIFPHGGIGFASSLLMLGAFIRRLFSEHTNTSKGNAVIMFSFGVGMAMYYFRCLYITLLIIGVITTIWGLYSYRQDRQKLMPILKFLSFSLLLVFLLNLYWVVPLTRQLVHGKKSLVVSDKILEIRENFSEEHRKMTNPLYSLRASTGGSGNGRPAHYYFSHPMVLPFSFLIPFYCFIPLLLKRIPIRIKLLSFISVLFLLYPYTFHIAPSINIFLRESIPTFWIMNDPSYWLLYVGVCYGLIIGSLTEHFLGFFDHSLMKKVAFTISVAAVVIIYGGGILLDKALVKGFYNEFTLFGNKLPYVKIPDEYNKLENYLIDNAKSGERLLYWDTGNYKKYTWSTQGHQPEILFYKSPIPAVGRPLTYATPIIDMLIYPYQGEINSNMPVNSEKLTLLMKNIANIRYLLVHKDYFFENDKNLNKALKNDIGKKNYFRKLIDNEKFDLYENRENSKGIIYASSMLQNHDCKKRENSFNYPVVVQGDLKSIPYLSYNSSAFMVIGQQEANTIMKLAAQWQQGSSGLIFFANDNLSSLALDVATARCLINANYKGLSSEKALLARLNKRGEVEFEANEGGTYDVWLLNNPALISDESSYLLKIDGKIANYYSVGLENGNPAKWQKVGEFSFSSGKHEIGLKKCVVLPKGEYKEDKIDLIQGRKILIISKVNFNGYKEIIEKNKIGYLYFDSNEWNRSLSSKEGEQENVGSVQKGSLSIGRRKFYIPEDGSYSIKALIRPKRLFTRMDTVGSSNVSSIIPSIDKLSGWRSSSVNTVYKQHVDDKGMQIKAYFRNKRAVREEVVLTKQFSDISLKDYPYMAFYCDIMDAGVQEVKISIKFKDDKKTFINALKSALGAKKKISFITDNKNFIVNLYKEAKIRFGKTAVDNLRIDEVTLNFRKKEGVDLSDIEKRRFYEFIFKDLSFTDTRPIFAEMNDDLSGYHSDRYYYFKGSGELADAGSPELIPEGIKDYYRLETQNFIDLKETSVVSLYFTKPALGDSNKEELRNECKIVLGIDFDGDSKADTSIERYVPVVYVNRERLALNIRAYDEVSKIFPGKRQYHLVAIDIGYPDNKKIYNQTVLNKKLVRYCENKFRQSDFLPQSNVIDLDGQIYKLSDRKAINNAISSAWIEFPVVFLKKGDHILDMMGSGRFKVEAVDISPQLPSVGISRKILPQISYEMINPTRYIVNVQKAQTPFMLIFSESFHNGWKAYIRQESEGRSQTLKGDAKEPWSALLSALQDRERRVEIKDHVLINGFANGWMIPVEQKSEVRGQKADNGEDFQIVLEFTLQRWYEAALSVSAVSFLCCIFYVVYKTIRRKKT